MEHQDDDLEKARSLSKAYSTLLTNKRIEALLNHYEIPAFSDYKEPRQRIDYYIKLNYFDETTVKAAFLEKVLFHTEKSATVAFEVPIGQSRIDLCKISKYSYAYEIKTEYDRFDRLKSQLPDYQAAFDFVYVVVPEKNFRLACDSLPDGIGIYTYKKWGDSLCFKLAQRAVKSAQNDPIIQLSAFSQSEIKRLKKCSSSNSKPYESAGGGSARFSQDVNRLFKNTLRNRYCRNWNFLLSYKEEILSIDYGWFFKNMTDPKKIYAF